MDAKRFDALTRALDLRSRRHLLGVLTGAAMSLGSLTLHSDIGAKKKRKKNKKKKKKTCPTCPPPPPPLSPQLAYACSGSEGANGFSGDDRLAQTFEPSRTGSLRQIQFGINKANGTTGDYFVQLLRVTALPGNGVVDVLATATIPNAAVPVGPFTIVGEFTGPQLVQGTTYAASVTRPGSAQLAVQARSTDGSACDGAAYVANGAGNFNPIVAPPFEFIVSVLVE